MKNSALLTKQDRIYGIDLLKCFSMLSICLLHSVGHGGIINALAENGFGAAYWAVLFLQLACFCGVNCFGMASGYLMIQTQFRFRKILPLYAVVFFYNLLFILVGALFFGEPVSVMCLFYIWPVTSSTYWYFTAYFGLFLLIPLINAGIQYLSKRQFVLVLSLGFVFFSVAPTVNIAGTDPFQLESGYSVWWLMYLYLLGAGIRKYDLFQSVSARNAFLGYLIAVFVTWASRFALHMFAEYQVPVLRKITSFYKENFLSFYTSPTVLVAGVGFMLWTLKLKISHHLQKVLMLISPLIFQVYLIQDHPVIRRNFMQRISSCIPAVSPWLLVGLVLVITFGVFFACLLIDSIRQKLFKVLKVDERIFQVADWCKALLQRIF